MSTASATLLASALDHHRRGDLTQAIQLYQRAVSVDASNAEALHLLGVALLQTGQPAQAIEWMERSVALQPNAVACQTNLGEAYRAVGRLDHAAACFQRALNLQPNSADAAYNFGLLLMQQGRVAESADMFRRATQQKPDFALAYNNLGNACRMLGDIEQAVRHFRRAVELNPQLGMAHGNLGQMLLEFDRPRDALLHCQEAVRLNPNLAASHNNLGNVLRRLGRLEDAKACYLEAVRRAPNLPMVHNNLGEIARDQGQPLEARRWFAQAVEREPNNAHYHLNLAKTLFDQHALAEAETHLLAARRLDPRSWEVRVHLAHVYFQQGRLADADTEYRTLVAERPNDPALQCRLAEVLMELNRREDALSCLRAALRADPNHAHALAQIATQLSDKLPPEEETAVRRLLENPNLPDGERSALLFALGQVCDARRDYEQAAKHLTRANQIEDLAWQQSGRGYHADAHIGFVDRLIKVFTPAFFERVRGFGLDSERTTFIVGLPRSGTSLLEQVLASHPSVFGAGELRVAREDFETLGGGSDGRSEAQAFDRLLTIDADTVRRLATGHLERLAALNSTAERIVDKMPDNYLYVGFMTLLFPRARFLHTCRDMRDIAVSCWLTHFRDIPWSNNFDMMFSRFSQYRRVMDHWHSVLPVPILDVHYEDMVEDLESVARRAIEFLGLAWDPACLEYHRNKRPVRTASLMQVRQPIYRRSLARWRNYQNTLQPLFGRLEQLFSPRTSAE